MMDSNKLSDTNLAKALDIHEINYVYVDVMKQTNASYCDVFVIAYAIVITLDIEPKSS